MPRCRPTGRSRPEAFLRAGDSFVHVGISYTVIPEPSTKGPRAEGEAQKALVTPQPLCLLFTPHAEPAPRPWGSRSRVLPCSASQGSADAWKWGASRPPHPTSPAALPRLDARRAPGFPAATWTLWTGRLELRWAATISATRPPRDGISATARSALWAPWLLTVWLSGAL